MLSKVAATSLAVLLTLAVPGRADPVADFYRNKTITISVGFTVGGGYDLYARLLSRHMGRHIPGNPTIVVQNMPGAGSQKATQFIYSIAPKDGTHIGSVSRGMITEPLLNNAPFDATKFSWLGTITNESSVCGSWHTSKVKTWEDMFAREFTMGGSGTGADPDQFALILRNVLGAKVRLVTGYPGGNEINLAMERGEVDGRCGWSWTSLKSQKAEWLRDKKAYMLVQFGTAKHADLPHVPLASDHAKTDEQRQIMRVLTVGQAVGRPFFAPPGIPEDRKAALRKAFDATMKDKLFLEEAAKLDMEVSPASADEVDKLLAEVYSTPKPVLEKALAATLK